MAYASRSGRARTSAKNPQAFAICDRCALWYNHVNLRWQYDWRGASMQNTKILVCETCYDTPQSQLRAIVVPADPTPIVNPRTEPYAWDSNDIRQLSGYNTIDPATGIPVPQGDVRVTTENNAATQDKRVTQQTGEAPGGLNQLPGTDPNAVTYRNVLNVGNNGGGLVRLTVDATNGIITGQRVIVQEVNGVPNANGEWTVIVVSEETLDLVGTIFAGAYIGGGYVINNPSLPRGFSEIPRTGTL